MAWVYVKGLQTFNQVKDYLTAGGNLFDNCQCYDTQHQVYTLQTTESAARCLTSSFSEGVALNPWTVGE